MNLLLFLVGSTVAEVHVVMATTVGNAPRMSGGGLLHKGAAGCPSCLIGAQCALQCGE